MKTLFVALQLHKRRRRLTLPTTRGKFSEVHRAPPGIRTLNAPQPTLTYIHTYLFMGGSTFMLCSHVTSKKFANLAISETFNSEKKVTRRTRGWTFCFCLYNWVEKKTGEPRAQNLENARVVNQLEMVIFFSTRVIIQAKNYEVINGSGGHFF